MTHKVCEKPKLRGVFHICGTVLSFTMLCVVCFLNYYTRFDSLIFTFLLIQTIQFAISSVYHMGDWSPNNRAIMRKIDHIAIIFLIYTVGTVLLYIHNPSSSDFSIFGTPLGISEIKVVSIVEKAMALISIIATLNVATMGIYDTALDQVFYIALGVLFVPVLFSLKSISYTSIALIVFAGGLDLLGALIFVFEKPNPFPAYVGFHEIFHLLTLVAFFVWAFVIGKQFMAENLQLEPVLKVFC